MKTVYKYPIAINDNEQVISAGMDGKPVAFMLQNGIPYVWVEHTPDTVQKHMFFRVFGTGHYIPDHYIHAGSLQDGPFVWHLYYR